MGTWSHMQMQLLTATSQKTSRGLSGPRQLECSSAHRASCFSPGARMESHLPGSHVAWLLEVSQDLRTALGLVGTLPPFYFCDPQGSYIISTFQVENQDSNVLSKAGKSRKDGRLMSRASQQEMAHKLPSPGTSILETTSQHPSSLHSL